MQRWRFPWKKVLFALAGLALFVAALELMQAGARTFAPVMKERFDVETPVGAFGFGWCAAYVLLSGSPVAATAVTFFDAGQIDEAATFAMITGSRFGAAFIVLLLGFFYVLYRRESTHDLRVGLLALIVTAAIYLPAFGLGWAVLDVVGAEGLSGLTAGLGDALDGSPIERVEEEVARRLPSWGVFLAGLVLILASFKLIDLGLPSMDAGDGDGPGRLRRYADNRWAMFGLGALLTLVTLSVSVSLGLLIPLHDRRMIHARQVVPYIMGANITTFVDTLLAALTMERNGALGIVVVEMGAVTVVSVLVLVFFYGPFERGALAAVDRVTATRASLAAFVAVLVLVPVGLLFAPRLF